jgi:hypothetical protein
VVEKWMLKASWPKHIKTNDHLLCHGIGEKEHEEAQAITTELAMEDTADFLNFRAAAHSNLDPPTADSIGTINSGERVTTTLAEQEMWEKYEQGDFMIEIDDQDALRKAKVKEFERWVEKNNLWAGIEEGIPDILDVDNPDPTAQFLEEEDAISELLESVGKCTVTMACIEAILISSSRLFRTRGIGKHIL